MIKIEVTETQKANLKKLADYLAALPEDYAQFDMGTYCDNDGLTKSPAGSVFAIANVCGTVACALGHGPVAGIRPLVKHMDWLMYCKTHFTSDLGALRIWLFSGSWDDVDNTPQGAAKRIYYFLENGGVPNNYHDFPTFYQE